MLSYKECPHCKISFHPKTSKQIYCSAKCSRDVQRKPLEICKQCGVGFKHKCNSTNVFCTRECGFKWKSEHSFKNTLSTEELREKNRKKKQKKFSLLQLNKCAECGKISLTQRTQKYCSNKCMKSFNAIISRERNFRRLAVEKECSICGKKMTVLPSKNQCSEECKQIHIRNLERKYRREARRDGRQERDGHRKRAKRFNVSFTKGVTLHAVRTRDGDRCLICGAKVLKHNVSGYHKRNATIGHLLAMSQGGSHSMDNVQLECMSCNIKLGIESHGQMRLDI